LKSLGHNLGLKDECKFFLGHEIDKLHYDKSPDEYPDYWKMLYKKLEPFLNVVSNDPEIVNTKQELRVMKESKDALTTSLAQANKVLEVQNQQLQDQVHELFSKIATIHEEYANIVQFQREQLKVARQPNDPKEAVATAGSSSSTATPTVATTASQ
ncbi:MAG: hypothetical protein ACRDF4_02340, partial [Rhabdochlamydiaceae bacterium]